MKCTIARCPFKRDAGLEKEEQMHCKNPKAQLSIEVRSNSNKKEYVCDICNSKTAAKVGGEGRRERLRKNRDP